MTFNPLHSVARLYIHENDFMAFIGTCFTFRHSKYFLTAAHCISGRNSENLHIKLQTPNAELLSVVRVIVHPTADIAILVTSDDLEYQCEPFWLCVDNWGLGEEFMAYGFPEDLFSRDYRTPTPRLFKGHFQRFLDYHSPMGYRYIAGELNIACPRGLSGGPLFRPGSGGRVVLGLVCENLETSNQLHEEQEISEDGATTIIKYKAVITYGIAIMLSRVQDWLHEHIPDARSTNR